MSSNKRRLLRTLGCGCSKPKPSEVYEPIPKPKISIYKNKNPSSLTPSTTSGDLSVDDDDDDEHFTSTSISEADTHHDHNKNITTNKNHGIPKPTTKLVDSIAVEKESKDPYNDFRYSMLQMIFEREIFSEIDLQELLECFLQLNPQCHHQVIVEAFIETCEEAFPKKFGGGSVAEPSRRNNHIIRTSR
ncbi:transcription repressor OFP6-like [Gastrolobium bilobum]|uniref:transcription repressor OFP6-like n=1 Tax=Gastrolobium bilobum TaxID=150636 RepID=UPI002AB065ED|nr:transcription repressor OFP6-like [Gastrolobium bilobum]